MMVLQSAICKMLARKALKGRWQTAMLVLFTATLPSMAAQVYQAIKGPDIYAAAIVMAQQGRLPQEIFTPSYWLIILLPLIASLLAVGLNLGALRYFIDILKGREASYKTVFSRLGAFLKGIWLDILISVIFMLCVAAIVGPFLLLAFNVPSFATSSFARFLATVVPIVSLGFALIVYLNFALASHAIAEDNSLSAFSALKKSRAWMKGHKGHLFFVYLSFFGWLFLQSALSYLLQNLFGAVIGMALGLFAGLAVSVYMTAAIAAFYVICSGGTITQIPSE